MTVSPAMWVTGNMASNMSLQEKETERERRRENTVITDIPAIMVHYLTVHLNCSLTHTHKHAEHMQVFKVFFFLSNEEQRDGKDREILSLLTINRYHSQKERPENSG